jgi:hypothetical protein
VYFLAGLEIGIGFIVVFLGLNALQGWGHRMIDQSKRGGGLMECFGTVRRKTDR